MSKLGASATFGPKSISTATPTGDGGVARDGRADSEPPQSLLRFVPCGSAGSGKSAVLDSLLEHASSLRRPARQRPGALARRVWFETGVRAYAAVDVPGDDRHTPRVTAALTTADVATLVVDAQVGILPQARRHALIASVLGVRDVILVINKIDTITQPRETFARIEAAFQPFAADLKLRVAGAIPVSARNHHNVATSTGLTPWYDGPTLLDLLEGLGQHAAAPAEQPLRFSVQRSLVGDDPARAETRGWAGTVLSGELRRGDSVRVQPSGRLTRVAALLTASGEVESASAGRALTVVLDDDRDVKRGDLIVPSDRPAEMSDQFEATLLWTSEVPLLRGRSYLVKIGAKTVGGTISPLKYKINVANLQRLAAPTLGFNEVGVGNLQLEEAIPFDPYEVNRETGGFILVDRLSNETVGLGVLHFALRRAQNVHWQALDVNKLVRASAKGQKPCVLWYTGLSGAGKSTIANLVDKRLHSMRRHTYLLDGDNIRHGLNKDLGFTAADRVENIRRIAEVAKLMVDAGLIVGTAFISPFRAERQTARSLLGQGEFIEVFIDTPIAVAEERDPKGLYKKARRGELKNFTGIDSPYEAPENPEIRINTTDSSPDEAAQIIVKYLEDKGMLKPD